MKTIVAWTAMIAATCLAGCAGASNMAEPWVGRDPAHLAADEAACRQEASAVDVNQASGYSDPRYGVTSAMASSIAKDNPLTDTRPQIKAASFAACMTDKGWQQP